MTIKTVLAASGVLLLAVGSANAITVSGLNPTSNIYAVSASAFASDYSGVSELTIVRSDLGTEGCSGALLADRVSILTAAHCVAKADAEEEATTAYVTFTLPDGSNSSRVVEFHVDPLYDGSPESPHDVALLILATPAPLDATRYNLYEGDALDQMITLAGYGVGGSGTTGYDGLAYPPGTLRLGENQYDAASGSGDYIFDFDDGTASLDAIGGRGLGAAEAFFAPGDFGGPAFIDGETAGKHSFITRILPDGSTVDIDDILDFSFGKYAGDGRVAYDLAFIQLAMGATPEPKTMFLVGVALIAFSLIGPKRRQQ